MIAEAVVRAAKRLPTKIDISTLKVGDRVTIKVLAVYRTRKTTVTVTEIIKGLVEPPYTAIMVKYQGTDKFVVYPGEIISKEEVQ